MTFKIVLNRFSPAEAAKIVQVSTTLQRNWRRHGYLPVAEGHARFDVFALAELYALGVLAARGVGPHQGIEVAELIGAGIVWNALAVRAAYEGDATILSSEPDTADEANLRDQVQAMGVNLGPDPLDWMFKCDKFIRDAFRTNGYDKRVGRVIPARYFLWFPDGSHSWQWSVDHCFTSGLFPTDGPVIVIDQRALGAKMVAVAGKPFVRIEAD